eukprot:scaffold9562_cov98-Isochrysis_galbana.AAC.2
MPLHRRQRSRQDHRIEPVVAPSLGRSSTGQILTGRGAQLTDLCVAERRFHSHSRFCKQIRHAHSTRMWRSAFRRQQRIAMTSVPTAKKTRRKQRRRRMDTRARQRSRASPWRRKSPSERQASTRASRASRICRNRCAPVLKRASHRRPAWPAARSIRPSSAHARTRRSQRRRSPRRAVACRKTPARMVRRTWFLAVASPMECKARQRAMHVLCQCCSEANRRCSC